VRIGAHEDPCAHLVWCAPRLQRPAVRRVGGHRSGLPRPNCGHGERLARQCRGGGATVKLTLPSTGVERAVTTNENGEAALGSFGQIFFAKGFARQVSVRLARGLESVAAPGDSGPPGKTDSLGGVIFPSPTAPPPDVRSLLILFLSWQCLVKRMQPVYKTDVFDIQSSRLRRPRLPEPVDFCSFCRGPSRPFDRMALPIRTEKTSDACY
jgi:hypothetical protein